MRRAAAVGMLVVGATFARASAEDAMSGPEVGKPAPAIRLNDHTGVAQRVGPGAGERWVVLAFFPKAMTPG